MPKDPTASVANMFEFASGSMTGAEHRSEGVNNQDAFLLALADDVAIVAVADGCSKDEDGEEWLKSEVGARIGLQIFVDALQAAVRRWLENDTDVGPAPFPFWEDVRAEVLGRLEAVILAMGGNRQKTIVDFFLFTLVGAMFTRRGAEFFHLGDGYVYVNGEAFDLAGPKRDEPAYLAYGLCANPFDPASLRFRTVRHLPLAELDNFVVSTDGLQYLIGAGNRPMPGSDQEVGPVSLFWEADRFFRNRFALGRRLTLLNGGPDASLPCGILRDDATLIVGRRKQEDHGP